MTVGVVGRSARGFRLPNPATEVRPVPTSRQNACILVTPPGFEPGPDERRALDLLGVTGDPVDPDEIPGGLPEGGGWLVLPTGTESDLAGRVLADLTGSPDPWALLWLEAADGGPGEAGFRVRPMSPGYPEDPDRISKRLSGSGMDPGYLNHRRVLMDLSRVRHDVNNALTSALAETQFMRMDNEPGTELAEGLALVEVQLLKIRDLMLRLSVLRVGSQ